MHNRFRGFELLDRIGSGGMSTIYLGVQTALDRKVAIKLLHPAFADDEQFIARFEREAKSASSLGHPNVVTIIDFGSENGAYYIVMELVDGADLRSIFQRCDRIPPEITLAILEEICHGLQAAHEKGIVHRDIKPGNVLLSGDGRVKVADFGLARQINDFDRMANITMTGAVVGTPAYMSPEQLAGATVDHRTDIYSLGVMAYEFFVGERPFRTSPSGVNTEEKILRGAVPPMERDGTRLPTYIVDLVSRMLAKDPEKRFTDVAELLRAVENAMEQIDDSGQLLKHRRDYLKRFAQEPIAFGRELQKRRLNRHLRRGDHFIGMGLERIDEAIEQYLAALRIDPENSSARVALDRLEREHGRGMVETVIGRTTSVFSSAPGSPASSGSPAEEPASRTGDPLLDEIDSDPRLEVRAADLATTASGSGPSPGTERPDRGTDPEPNRADESREPAADATTQLRENPGVPRSSSETATVSSATGGSATEPVASRPQTQGGRPLWSRPWLWAVLVATLVAVPSLTLGPLRPGPRDSVDDGVDPILVVTPEVGNAGSDPIDLDLASASDETGLKGPDESDTDTTAPPLTPRGKANTSNDIAGNSESEDAASARTDPAPGPGTQSVDLPDGDGDAEAGKTVTPVTTRPTETPKDPPTEPALTPRADRDESPGFIEVRVVPVADIYVDDQLVGRKSRFALHRADPTRNHVVEVRHPSFGIHRWSDVSAARDTTQLVHRYSWGDVRIEWTPPGPVDLSFDDLVLGEAPSFSRQVAVGEHRIQIRRAGYRISEVRLLDTHGTRSLSGPEVAGAPATYLVEVGERETTRVNIVFVKE